MAINRIYSVYSTSDTNVIPIQSIANFIRYNTDGSKLIIEWTKTPPEGTVVLTHDEAVALVSQPDWFDPEAMAL